MSDLDGSHTSISFGENGRVATVERDNARSWTYTYAATGALEAVHRNGERILDRKMEELANGDWRLLVRDVHGATTERTFDGDGLLSASTNALGERLSYEYDPVGRLAGWSDPRGATVRFEHDGLGRIVLTENAAGQRESRRYDLDGRLTNRDNGEQDIDYDFNNVGQLEQVDFGRGEEIDYEYDEFGRIAQTVSGDVTTRFRYDALDRLVIRAVQLPDGSIHTTRYTFGPAGEKTRVRYYETAPDQERPTLVSDTGYAHDALGRITKVTVDGAPKVVYHYDSTTLRLEGKDFANGSALRYEYDPEGRVASVTVWNAQRGLIEAIAYQWSSDGRLVSRKRSGPSVAESMKRLESANSPPIFLASEDGTGQFAPVSLVQHYRYDLLGRLVAVTSPEFPQLDETYVYDESGNLLEKTVAGKTATFTYDLANQLRTRETGGEITRYRYDKAGRLAEERVGNTVVADYRYGYRDRVMEVVRDDSAARFFYDAGGLLVGKQKGKLPDPAYQIAHAGFGFFGKDEGPAPVYESTGIEPWVWEDAFGAGGAPRGAKALLARGAETFANEPHVSGGVPIVSKTVASGTSPMKDPVEQDLSYHVSDFLGNSLLELRDEEKTGFDGSRKSTAGFAYLTASLGSEVVGNSASGEVGGSEASGAKITSRFTGKPYDEDLQAHVFPYRNYSSDLGRWTSADPAGFPDGPNRHFYAPVPTNGLDPLGLWKAVVSTGVGYPNGQTINLPEGDTSINVNLTGSYSVTLIREEGDEGSAMLSFQVQIGTGGSIVANFSASVTVAADKNQNSTSGNISGVKSFGEGDHSFGVRVMGNGGGGSQFQMGQTAVGNFTVQEI